MFMPPNATAFNADGKAFDPSNPPPIHDGMFGEFDAAKIPTLGGANLADDAERFLWAFMCTPGMERTGAAMLLMEDSLRKWSTRMSECGAVLDPDRMRIRYVPPADDASFFDNGAGYWEPIPEEQRAEFIGAVKERMRALGVPVPGDLRDALADAEERAANVGDVYADLDAAEDRIAELTAEVARLKQQNGEVDDD